MRSQLSKEVMQIKYLAKGQSWKNKVNNMVEKLYRPWFMNSKKEIYEALYKFEIIFGGSVTANIDNDLPVSLSNCFVIEAPKDNYEDILRAEIEAIHVMKRRGGVGIDLSNIRPKGSKVNNAAVTSTGIVPFMERYSNMTREVAQDGRRGALMLTIDIRHPDAEDFIDAKTNTNKVTGANISVKLSKEFMEAAIRGKTYIQQFPINSTHPTVVKQVDARKLLTKIASNITNYAEPGILFWDSIMDNRIDKECYENMATQSTNPCGEIPLAPYDSCRLIHLNLYLLVENKFTSNSHLNIEKLNNLSRMIVDLGNAMIEEEEKKIKRIISKIKEEDSAGDSIEHKLWEKILFKAVSYRRLGIGKTGDADFKAAMGMKYAGKAADKAMRKVLGYITDNIEVRSEELRDFIPSDLKFSTDRINIGLHTVAPVGSGSIIADTTSGIEPLFGPLIQRRRRAVEKDRVENIEVDDNGDKWIKYIHVHEPLLEWARINKVAVDVEDTDSILKAFKKSPYFGNTAADIIPAEKLSMQAVYQEVTDHSISITHNYPKGTPEKVIYSAILDAYGLNLKGFTAYVDGSRTNILEVVTTETSSDRPEEIKAEVHKLKTKDDNFYGIVGLRDSLPREIFIFKDNAIEIKSLKNAKIVKRIKEGVNKYDLTSDSITIKDLASRYRSGNNIILTKLLSRLLRRGESIEKIKEDFNTSHGNIGSFQNTITTLLEYYTSNKCIACGEDALAFQEGCLTCQSCGNSKCG